MTRHVVLMLLMAGPAWADPPAVRLPDPPAVPTPMPPAPAPGAVVRLTADRLYVIDSDVPVIVVASPAGLVTVSDPEPGPVKVRGKFVDSPTGKVETRTFKGKSVTTVEAAHSGTVELIVIPEGAKTPADVIRRTVEVDAGDGPRPPPVPPTPPTPTPTPTPPIPGDGARVLIVYESGDLSSYPPAQANVLYAKSVRDYLNRKTAVGPDGKTREWRIYDKDVDATNESPAWQAALKRPRTSLPWVVVSDGKAGYEGPLPATADDTLTLLKKYLGD